MRGYYCLMTITMVAVAQQAPLPTGAQPGTTVESGVPLRIALERRVAIKRRGQPVQGRLVEPIYVFDREILPAGSIVEGHVAEIGGVPAGRRFRAILSGNLTPPREVRAQFDSLVLSDGSRLSLRTAPSLGTAHTTRVAPKQKKPAGSKSPLGVARDAIGEMDRAAVAAFKTPGKANRLKSTLIGMLPYHRQAWSAGTLFSGVLQDSLTGLPSSPSPTPIVNPTVSQPEAREINASLRQAINSRSARRGELVEAVVTRPLFSAGNKLEIPAGSLLFGDIVDVQPARWFHRNGKVFFVFRQIQLAGSAAQSIQGHLAGIEANLDSHMALDPEGVIHTSSPRARFIFPALAVAAAGLSFHQDYNAQGVPDQDIAGRAESGAVGLGLIGSVLAQASRTAASSIAFAGAGFSVYSNFIARGENVVLPANTPVKVTIRTRADDASDTQPTGRSVQPPSCRTCR